MQGKGLASKLLEPVLNMADAEGKKCVTWFFEPRNMDFFQKQGFKFVFRMPMPEGLPEATVVVRDNVAYRK